MLEIFFQENREAFDNLWKSVVEPDRAHIAI
jgi:hypothetical protein